MYTLDKEQLVENNAVEPKISYAEYPSPEQQVWYALQGAIGIVLLTLLALTTSFVIWWKF
ncbi:ssl1498 family light-harvesting-like protein [Chlorogloeopsis sp. ULAP01]|uniref:photosystem II assembly protein Psb34 n=1 Tax=Chlorogloeopsis sp. ULAP01 TaxID=3056483 RepID=UPI0025AAB410|nr:ssl1498 family light-harvesting-like protein [Chlorogloeopsis sp. ULAP01]MDM9383933.1 ssl1498 family light-harvesting-like protein [Chlorogloeopsis sp. ULAP01]